MQKKHFESEEEFNTPKTIRVIPKPLLDCATNRYSALYSVSQWSVCVAEAVTGLISKPEVQALLKLHSSTQIKPLLVLHWRA